MEHNSRMDAKLTKSCGPVGIFGFSPGMAKSKALQIENRFKKLLTGRKISELQSRRIK